MPALIHRQEERADDEDEEKLGLGAAIDLLFDHVGVVIPS
jgi:hypothetical protein